MGNILGKIYFFAKPVLEKDWNLFISHFCSLSPFITRQLEVTAQLPYHTQLILIHMGQFQHKWEGKNKYMEKKTSFLETWRWFSRLDSETRMVEGREPFWRLHCGCSLDVLWQEPDWEANAGVSAFSFLFVWLRRLFPGPVRPQRRVLGYLWCLVVSLKITNTERKTKPNQF